MTISLSDRLKSWEVIERRLHSALDADLVIAVYNPGSRSRGWQVAALKELLQQRLPADRPVILGHDVGGEQQRLTSTTVAGLDPDTVDMRTLLIIGSSTTRVVARAAGDLVFTSRRYEQPAD